MQSLTLVMIDFSTTLYYLFLYLLFYQTLHFNEITGYSVEILNFGYKNVHCVSLNLNTYIKLYFIT